jgi:transcriptional antiterminator
MVKWTLTQKEIAEILGVSERTINRKFTYYKNNL